MNLVGIESKADPIGSDSLLFNANSVIYFSYIGPKQVNFQCDDDEVRSVLDQHA
jgi:hypothetical protein